MAYWKTEQGHRGDGTENLINVINNIYRLKNIALVTKTPTPIKVLSIKKGKIVNAFFEEKSTVDYTGIVQGYGIAFDAKETNEISFPLKNIHQHQIDYMEDFKNQKGCSFIICNFKRVDKFFLIPFEVIKKYWEDASCGGRKSIPIKALDEKYLIPMKDGLPHYIETFKLYLGSMKKKST